MIVTKQPAKARTSPPMCETGVSCCEEARWRGPGAHRPRSTNIARSERVPQVCAPRLCPDRVHVQSARPEPKSQAHAPSARPRAVSPLRAPMLAKHPLADKSAGSRWARASRRVSPTPLGARANPPHLPCRVGGGRRSRLACKTLLVLKRNAAPELVHAPPNLQPRHHPSRSGGGPRPLSLGRGF